VATAGSLPSCYVNNEWPLCIHIPGIEDAYIERPTLLGHEGIRYVHSSSTSVRKFNTQCMPNVTVQRLSELRIFQCMVYEL
jgi:hypothetical protein